MDRTILLIWILSTTGYVSSINSTLFSSDTKCNWQSCKEYCEANNSRLIVLDSQIKYDLVTQQLGDMIFSGERYIGLFTTTLDCTDYTWTNGELLSWSKWYVGEPDGCSTDQCVRLYRGWFRTVSCHRFYYALCEYVNFEPSSPITTTSVTTQKATSSTRATQTSSASSAMTSVTEKAAENVTQTPPPEFTSVTEKAAENVTQTSPPEFTSVSEKAAENVTQTPPPESTYTQDPCRGKQVNITQLSTAELLESIKLLKEQLTVMKNSTSIALRKKISVYESRPTCLVMGGVATAIICILIGLIVVPDIITLYMYVYLANYVNKRNAANL